MKWLIAIMLAASVLLSAYAVCRTKRIEAATKPRMQLIALNAG